MIGPQTAIKSRYHWPRPVSNQWSGSDTGRWEGVRALESDHQCQWHRPRPNNFISPRRL